MVKEFRYRGHTEEELKKMTLKDFSKIVSAKIRRSLKRGFNPFQKRLLEKVREAQKHGRDKPIKTNCRDMPIVPDMLGLTIRVHNGNKFVPVDITPERLGHYLGEFTLTRERIKHSAPGVGATRSSKFIPLK